MFNRTRQCICPCAIAAKVSAIVAVCSLYACQPTTRPSSTSNSGGVDRGAVPAGLAANTASAADATTGLVPPPSKSLGENLDPGCTRDAATLRHLHRGASVTKCVTLETIIACVDDSPPLPPGTYTDAPRFDELCKDGKISVEACKHPPRITAEAADCIAKAAALRVNYPNHMVVVAPTPGGERYAWQVQSNGDGHFVTHYIDPWSGVHLSLGHGYEDHY